MESEAKRGDMPHGEAWAGFSPPKHVVCFSDQTYKSLRQSTCVGLQEETTSRLRANNAGMT